MRTASIAHLLGSSAGSRVDTTAPRLKNLCMKSLAGLAVVIGAVACLGCASASAMPTWLPDAAANEQFVSGLHHLYGFNYAAAEAAFRRAFDLDPTAPLPLWGLAMALGPSTNAPELSAEQMQNAHVAAQRARALSTGSSPRTQALISATASRYAASAPFDQHKLDVAYSRAMRAIFEQFPRDSDIATLLVESQMLAREGLAWTGGLP